MPRRAVSILSLLLLAACTGDAPGSQRPSSSASAGRARARATSEAAPAAQMQVGTDVSHGVLTKYCEGSRCDADPAARPPRDLPAAEGGVLLFVLKRAPDTANVEIVRRGSDERALERALHAGTPTLAVHEDLTPGRYVVRLSAGWRGHQATWLFGLKVART